MLNEVVYCPRLAYLEWVQGEFAHNSDTVEGRTVHRTVDRPKPAGLKRRASAQSAVEAVESGEADEMAGTIAEDEPEAPRVLRSLTLQDEALGLVAVIDLCELDEGRAVPVDTKKGASHSGEVWEADRVQLCAQCLLLEAHGYQAPAAVAYYAQEKRRVEVVIDQNLVERTLRARDQLLALEATRQMPPPLVDDARCVRCSLNGICLPDETRHLRGESTDPPRAEAAPSLEFWQPALRRLVPARPETVPLYVVSPGAQVRKKEECLDVWSPDEGSRTVRLLELESVNLLGPVQVTAQAQAALLRAQIPICHFSHGGWFTGMTIGLGLANVELRRAQYRAADDPAICLALSREFIRGKVKNQRTLLRRSLGEEAALDLRRMRHLLAALPKARDLDHVLGLEGAAARIWFRRLPEVLASSKSDHTMVTSFAVRNRRPPMDPVNAMLSYGYGVLVKEAAVALERAGLESRLGFLHKPRGGRPSMALDLMEEFRPLIVDSAVLGLVARGEVDTGDFVRCGDAVSLSTAGKRKLLSAYERRMDTLIQHPVFGYTISYRRVLDVQARLLGRALLGELPAYAAFTTR